MILGVTGGIASGKSSVTEVFRSFGAAVISADQLAREAVRPGSRTLAHLVERFGRQILQPDGSLDRQGLAALIFRDPQARRDLNHITHPAIAALAEERLARLVDRGEHLIVYEAPLLYEAGAEGRVDAVLVVRIDPALQVARLMARDGIGEQEARQRIDAQMPQEEKIARADYVVDNSGTPAQTAAQVRHLARQLFPAPPEIGR